MLGLRFRRSTCSTRLCRPLASPCHSRFRGMSVRRLARARISHRTTSSSVAQPVVAVRGSSRCVSGVRFQKRMHVDLRDGSPFFLLPHVWSRTCSTMSCLSSSYCSLSRNHTMRVAGGGVHGQKVHLPGTGGGVRFIHVTPPLFVNFMPREIRVVVDAALINAKQKLWEILHEISSAHGVWFSDVVWDMTHVPFETLRKDIERLLNAAISEPSPANMSPRLSPSVPLTLRQRRHYAMCTKEHFYDLSPLYTDPRQLSE